MRINRFKFGWVVAGLAIAMLILPAGPAARAAVGVPIVNPSFEGQVLADGVDTGTVLYWTKGKYDSVSAPTVWIVDVNNNIAHVSGVGVYNPTAADGYGGIAADGNNVAWVDSHYHVGYDTGAYQVLVGPTSTLMADAQYNLSVKVGNPYLYNGSIPATDWRIDLVAGGVILATATGPSPVDDTYWTTASLTYNSGAAPAQLGQPLEIRVLSRDSYPDSRETYFDSVSLLGTYSHPIAVPGGLTSTSGYKAYRGGSLTLDGSGSIASEGSSLSLYEWDLNNDGTYDLTGATPASISYANLMSTYGMAGGDNTIRLRVTDVGTAETVTAFGTVTVLKDKLYWDTNGTTAGSGKVLTGTWGTANYWNTDDTGAGSGEFQPPATPTASKDDLYFGAGPSATDGNTAFTITVSGAQVARSLNFQSSGAPTVSGGTSITLGGGTAGSGGITVPQYAYGTTAQGAVTISTPIILNNSQAWTVGSGRTLTVSGAVTESSSGMTLTKSGPGILVLSKNVGNTYSGGTVIDEGRVQFNTGAVPPTGLITINSAGALSGAAYGNVAAWLASGKIVTSSSGVIAMVAANNAAVNFSTGGYNNLYLGATGAFAFGAYALTPGTNGYLLGGGGGTLTLGTAGTLVAGKNLTVGGNVTISAANSGFNGTATVNAGTLTLSAASALGSASSVTVGSGSTMTVSNATALGGSTAIQIAGGTVSLNATGTVISAPITLNGGGMVTTPLNSTTVTNIVTLNGAIGGTGNLTLQASNGNNTSPIIVLGAAGNYSGNTLLWASGNGNMAVQVAPGVANPLPTGTVLTTFTWYDNRYVELDLNGNNQTLAGLKSSDTGDYYGLGVIANSSATPCTLTVNNSADYLFAGCLGTGGVPAGYGAQPLYKGDNLGLTKGGSGKLVLAGMNGYTGDTVVGSGTLALAGGYTNNIASSATIKVAGGAGLNVTGLDGGTIVLGANQTLKGSGTVTGNVTAALGSKIAPGDSAGTLKVIGNVEMKDDAIYEWEFGAATADKVVVTGNLTLDSGWKLSLASAGGTPVSGSTYDLFTYTGSFGGTILAEIIAKPVDWPAVSIRQDTTPGAGRVYLKFGSFGDTNNDGVVNAADYVTVKKNFGTSTGAGASAGDFNSDNRVNWADLNILTGNIGSGSGAPGTAPEPATLGLLAIGALAMLRRNRRS